MKLFMRSLTGDALSWYISQNPKKWPNWVSMVLDFIDRLRFNTENAPDVFYIQNFKKKPTEIFREYATRWRSEAAKVGPSLDEEQMNKFFVKAQDPQYYERLMVIENCKFTNIIKLGERIEEGIKSGMVINFEALQATNKALQSGGISKKKEQYYGIILLRLGEKGRSRVYTLEHLGGSNKDATTRQPIIETGLDDLWRKVQAREYSVVNHLNKVPTQISILSLLQNSEAHKNALMKVLSEAYVPNNITDGEMANMVGQVSISFETKINQGEV
ncbi:uncharacterized protein [Nicotiana sylvestris]|uniref:uncharacterized protein n=1 Tax=Nicotiana sylvestris TaxID=4096 RepID=UPI00388CD743